MKFAIGTSQFIKNYGILKKKSKKKDLIQIIKKYSSKIDLIDTAPSYDKAEDLIGIHGNKKIKIVTKINKITKKNINLQNVQVNKSILKSLQKLRKKKIYAVLFHEIKDVNIVKNHQIKMNLDLIKETYVNKLGFSCYDIYNVEKYMKLYNFDIIQFPINIFNISKKKISFLKNLKRKYNVELHARSAFLQGVILSKNLKFPINNKIFKKKIDQLDNISSKYKISKYNFCLSAINSLKVIDYTIIGLSNLNEYGDLLNFKKKKIDIKDIFMLEIKNKNILDPRKWKVNW